MADHKKPTKEEIEAERKKALEALENPEPTPSTEDPEPTPSKEDPEPTPSKEDEQPSPSEPEPTPSPEPSKELYKRRYKDSTREAMVQKAGRDAMAKAIEEAESITAPTEDEMKAEYPDWDVMSETERKIATKNVINDKRFARISLANKEAKDLNTWIEKVESFSTDPKILAQHPELEGNADGFRAFAITPSRRGVPLEDLVKAFLFDVEKSRPPKKKGSMMPLPSGGPGTKGQQPSGKISMTDAMTLRETNYAKYREYLKAGLIDQSSIK